MSDSPDVGTDFIERMLDRRPDLESCVDGLTALKSALIETFESGGKLLVCGNGGSMADAMHIAGELEKGFERKRPIPAADAERIERLPFGRQLVDGLEGALPVLVLGLNHSLKTAVENDSPVRDIAFAQEVYANVRAGDLLLGISTSGNADNCTMAMSVAKAMGATVAVLTGPDGGAMAKLADITVRCPGDATKLVQESHLVVYHTLCAMIETHFFAGD